MGDDLPRLHESETGPVHRLRRELALLDGPMSPSNALVPLEAHDVGDVPIDANPRARDLADADMDCDNGYVEYGGCVVEYDDESGRYIMSDPPNAGEMYMHADGGSFIGDISEWA